MCRAFVLCGLLSLVGCAPASRVCDSSTCASGCCDSDGECQGGSGNAACGSAGKACSVCSNNQQCLNLTCMPGAGGGQADAGLNGADAGAEVDAGFSDAGISDGGLSDAGGELVPPVSICGADDNEITSVSTQWGPAWARPNPAEILVGWPLQRRYELWWIPMPAAPRGTLAYRIRVPVDFDASTDPSPTAQLGYVRTAESPSTPVAAYEVSLSETACDFQHPLAIQSDNPPYGPGPFTAYSDVSNGPSIPIQVRPKSMTHCVPLGGYGTVCLEPGHTYWWNLRVVPGGCDGTLPGDTSTCQPMIHVMRPKTAQEP